LARPVARHGLGHLPNTDGAVAAAIHGLGRVYALGKFSKPNTICPTTLMSASTQTEQNSRTLIPVKLKRW